MALQHLLDVYLSLSGHHRYRLPALQVPHPRPHTTRPPHAEAVQPQKDVRPGWRRDQAVSPYPPPPPPSFPQSWASLWRWMCHWCPCQVERSHLGQTASLSRYCATTSIHLPASLTASALNPVSRRRIVIELSWTRPPFCSRFFAIRLQKRQGLLLNSLNCIPTEEARAVRPAA